MTAGLESLPPSHAMPAPDASATAADTPAPSTDAGGGEGKKTPAASFAERRAAALAKLRGEEPPAAEKPAKLAGVEAKAEPDAPADEPAPEPAKADEPKPDAGETAKEKARLAQALADLKKRDKALLEQQQAAKAAEAERAKERAELEAMRAKFDAISKNPIKALEASGLTFDELAKKVLAGEVKAPTPEDALKEQLDARSTELSKKLEALEAKLAEAEREKAERAEAEQRAQVRAQDLTQVKTVLESVADKYPLASSLSWGAERILDICYQQGTNDVTGVAEQLEAAARKDLESIIGNQKALAALVKSQPKLRETLRAVIGPESSRKTPASSEGPRVVAADMVSAPTTPIDRPKTPAERKKAALAKLMGDQ